MHHLHSHIEGVPHVNKSFFLLTASIFIFAGCGTTSSLDRESGIPQAIVSITDSLQVSGPIVFENDTAITIVAFGAPVNYVKAKVKSIQKVTLPDERAVQVDIVNNTSRTASNTAFLAFVAIMSIIAAISATSY